MRLPTVKIVFFVLFIATLFLIIGCQDEWGITAEEREILGLDKGAVVGQALAGCPADCNCFYIAGECVDSEEGTFWNGRLVQDRCFHEQLISRGCLSETSVIYCRNTCEHGCDRVEKVCIEPDIEGCTDSTATNYNPDATVNDGSCEFPPVEVEGCTDMGALNYNPDATLDDGSCEYAPECTVPTDGMVILEDTTFCAGEYELPNGISIGSDDVELDCNEATLQGTYEEIGIILRSKNNIIIKNCNLIYYNLGISLESSNNNLLLNNHLTNFNFHAVTLYLSSSNTLEGNLISNCGDDGIRLLRSSDNVLKDNTIKESTYFGIRIAHSLNNLVDNNDLQENTDGSVYLMSSSNNRLTNNVASNNGYSGIVISSSNGNSITNNAIQANGRDGIDLDYSEENHFSDNLVSDNRLCGFRMISSGENSLLSNQIFNSEKGICLFEGSVGNIIEENNIYEHRDYNLYNDQAESITAQNNYWGTVNQAAIAEKIYDGSDDFSLGVVNFCPFLNAPHPEGDSIPCVLEIPGCTDSDALNYNAEATADDGSCEYCFEGSYRLTDGDLGVEVCLDGVWVDATCNAYSIPTGSPGGGGGSSGGASSGTFEKRVWTSIDPGETIIVGINHENIAVTEINFDVSEMTYGAWLQIKRIYSLPSSIEEFPREVYQYLDITSRNVDVAQNIHINFKVEKSWLTENGLEGNDIALFRYNDNLWDELPPTQESEDDSYIYYTTTSPGFSYFVIGERE